VRITDPDVVRTSGASVHPIVAASADPADQVPGTVLEVTDAELSAADAYEVPDYKKDQRAAAVGPRSLGRCERRGDREEWRLIRPQSGPCHRLG
jgi:hypothetical protein